MVACGRRVSSGKQRRQATAVCEVLYRRSRPSAAALDPYANVFAAFVGVVFSDGVDLLGNRRAFHALAPRVRLDVDGGRRGLRDRRVRRERQLARAETNPQRRIGRAIELNVRLVNGRLSDRSSEANG